MFVKSNEVAVNRLRKIYFGQTKNNNNSISNNFGVIEQNVILVRNLGTICNQINTSVTFNDYHLGFSTNNKNIISKEIKKH